MMGKVGRLTITVLLILAIALTLDACNLPTGIGEEVLQRTTEHTEHEHTTTTRSTSSSGSSSGTCPAGVVCSSSSSSSENSSLTFRTIPSTTTSLTFRTLTSSSTPRLEPGCTYWGFLPGAMSNVTITISGTRTNQTNSTVVQTTCVIPGFPLEGTIVGAAVGLLFVIMSRRKSRRAIRN
jgi:predicted small secreted protein